MTFENLCFESGSIKGLAYIGMIKELDNLGLLKNITRFVGTSVGSLFATLLTIGYTSNEIENLDLDFSNIIPTSCFVTKIYNVLNKFGCKNSDVLKKKYIDIISKKVDPNITLSELFKLTNKELVIVTCCLNKLQPVYLHHSTFGSVKLIDALIASTLIPVYFKAIKFNFLGTEDYYVDGSVVNGYPMWIFNDLKNLYANKIELIDKSYINKHTLGFKLLDKDESNTRQVLDTNLDINNITEYINTVINTIMLQNERSNISSSYISQTISVYTGDVIFLDFNLSDNKKTELIQRGRDSVIKYFSKKNELKEDIN